MSKRRFTIGEVLAFFMSPNDSGSCEKDEPWISFFGEPRNSKCEESFPLCCNCRKESWREPWWEKTGSWGVPGPPMKSFIRLRSNSLGSVMLASSGLLELSLLSRWRCASGLDCSMAEPSKSILLFWCVSVGCGRMPKFHPRFTGRTSSSSSAMSPAPTKSITPACPAS